MVFALSGVTLFRKGEIEDHPYGYCLAAQAFLGKIALVGNLDAIQNLLLIARVGMYHHIEMSIWDISRFCMRQCIEQGLHVRPEQQRSRDLLMEQHRRRIFWECYVLDRYSSGVLGRPYAISDNDITVDLPIDASDDTIVQFANAERLEDVPTGGGTNPTELSVFIYIIQLRRITSRIHSDFYDGRSLSAVSGDTTPSQSLSPGDVYVKLYHFLDELDEWRAKGPIFAESQSLYEKPDWYDFMFIKDKLLLVRAAMHITPKQNGRPPPDLLKMSLEFATATIELYDSMARRNLITWSRSYFQVIFAAGLSIIYCVSLGICSEDHQRQPSSKASHTLNLCSQILQKFRKEMPDAGRFAIVFEMLRSNLLRDSASVPETPYDSAKRLVEDRQQTDPVLVAHTQSDTHLGVAQDPTDMDLLAQAATWPQNLGNSLASAGGVTDMSASQYPADPLQGQMHSDMPGLQLGHSTDGTIPWPILTDEIMGQLETGLGEYAWDIIGTGNITWDETDWTLS